MIFRNSQAELPARYDLELNRTPPGQSVNSTPARLSKGPYCRRSKLNALYNPQPHLVNPTQRHGASASARSARRGSWRSW